MGQHDNDGTNGRNGTGGTPGTARERLADRRGHEVFEFEHGTIRYTVGIGRFADGRLAEIFLNTAKYGTGLDTNAREQQWRLLPQYGCPLEVLRRALTRNVDGSASGPLAYALDQLPGNDD